MSTMMLYLIKFRESVEVKVNRGSKQAKITINKHFQPS